MYVGGKLCALGACIVCLFLRLFCKCLWFNIHNIMLNKSVITVSGLRERDRQKDRQTGELIKMGQQKERE